MHVELLAAFREWEQALTKPDGRHRYLRILLLGLRDQVRDALQVAGGDTPDRAAP